MNKLIILIMILSVMIYELNSQWQQTAGTPQGAGVTDMVVLQDGTLIVTAASYNWPSGQPGGIRRSTDGGNTWQNINEVYNARTLWLGSTGKIFASCWPYPNFEGAYSSTNNGANWTQIYTLSGTNNIFAIASKDNDNTIFLGTRDGVRRSTNGGSGWTNTVIGFPANSWVRDLAIASNGTVFAATTNGLFKTTNNGNLWELIPGMVEGDTIVKLDIIQRTTDLSNTEVLQAGTSNGKVYESDGSYLTMVVAALFDASLEITFLGTVVELPAVEILTMFPHSPGQQGGVERSTNSGANYSAFNEGLPDPAPVSAAAISKGSAPNMFIGLFQNSDNGAKIFKRSFPIGIQQISSEIPSGYVLFQNYPNPFNPVTGIKLNIPIRSFVRLIVYDLLGREIAVLINKELMPGIYSAGWNASGYYSGIYFYRLEADGFSETKKMVLIK